VFKSKKPAKKSWAFAQMRFQQTGLLSLLYFFLFAQGSLASGNVRLSQMARGNGDKAMIELRSECQTQAHCRNLDSLEDAQGRICVYKCISEECYKVG
jgi:hypothetical protein